ncbi:RNA ligase, T4 RnlA family protein [Pelomyxa schiedti]|nr:RNA ligase, T4 RnlA family protein [Pelomyxa schiedti]
MADSNKVRVSLCTTSGAKRGVARGVVVVDPAYDAIVDAARKKFNLNKKQLVNVRLFVNNGERIGTELPRGDLRKWLTNDTMVSVSLGEDYVFPDGVRKPPTIAKQSGSTPAEKDTLAATGNTSEKPKEPIHDDTTAHLEAASAASEKQALNTSSPMATQTLAHIPRPPRHPWPAGVVASPSDTNAPEVAEGLTDEVGQRCSGSNSASENVIPISPSAKATQNRFEFCGLWPVLQSNENLIIPNDIKQGNVLTLLLESIHGCDDFVVKERGGFFSFDYSTDSVGRTFPDPEEVAHGNTRERWMRALRRECRGLLVSSLTGIVLARRFPKFWNVDEVPETNVSHFGSLPPNVIATEKIDGSLASPLLVQDKPQSAPCMKWATRTSVCPEIEKYLQTLSGTNGTPQYVTFAQFWLERGFTPLFEWCQTGRPVGVIEHSSPSLTLLAIRNNEKGFYIPLPEIRESAAKYAVPVVPVQEFRSLCPDSQPLSLQKVLDIVSQWQGKEGVVLTFPDTGKMLKVKTKWYTSQAYAAKNCGKVAYLQFLLQHYPSIQDISPDSIWTACLSEDAETVIPSCIAILQGAKQIQSASTLQSFWEQLKTAFTQLQTELLEWGHSIVVLPGNQKKNKEAALSVGCAQGFDTAVLLSSIRCNAKQLQLDLYTQMKKLVHARKWDALSGLLSGVCWPPKLVSGCTPLVTLPPVELPASQFIAIPCAAVCTFQVAAEPVVEHVLHKYLPRKIASYFGLSPKAVDDETIVKISPTYSRSEGKIKGMWELFANKGLIDLRIDLQPPRAEGFTDHYGDRKWANLMVQFGASKLSQKSSKPRPNDVTGAFAGLLIQTDASFNLKCVREALKLSFETHATVFVAKTEDVLPEIAQINMHHEPEPSLDLLEISAHPVLKNSASQERHFKIFLDLDDVLADFSNAVFANTQRHPYELTKEELWHKLKLLPSFFEKLDWTKDGVELWKFLSSVAESHTEGISLSICILTGGPSGKFGKKVALQKKSWCTQHLGGTISVITCATSEKSRYSGPLHVLIDDNPEQENAWEAGGGIFVHHTSAAETIKQMSSMLSVSSTNFRQDLQKLIDVSASHTSTFVLSQEVVFVTEDNRESCSKLSECSTHATVVGLDAEWLPEDYGSTPAHNVLITRKQHRASIMQIAFRYFVFVIDMHSLGPKITDCIEKLLANASVLKLGFGLREDIPRLGFECSVTPVLDFQVIAAHVSMQTRDKVSLGYVAQQFLGKTMSKAKALQASNWEQRPLTQAQLNYAASDAAVLLELYDAFCSTPTLERVISVLNSHILPTSQRHQREYVNPRSSPPSSSQQEQQEFVALEAVVVEYAGIFLSEESRQILLSTFPPLHKNVAADHVTLSWKPDSQWLEKLPVGIQCQLRVTSEVHDSQGQAVLVELLAHIEPIAKSAASPDTLSDEDNEGSDSDTDENGDKSTAVEDSSENESEDDTDETGDEDASNETEEASEETIPDLANIFSHCSSWPHITISTSSGTASDYSNTLINASPVSQFKPDNPLCIKLEGKIGVLVKCPQDTCLQIPKKALAKINELIEFGNPGEHLRFKRGELTSTERYMIHQYAEKHGLEAYSEGREPNRQLIVTLPKNWNTVRANLQEQQSTTEKFRIVSSAADLDEESKKAKGNKDKGKTKEDEFQRVTEASSYRRLKFVSESPDDLGAGAVDGMVTADGIQWSPNECTGERSMAREIIDSLMMGCCGDTVVIIMRGLPGSGKSHLTSLLCSRSGEEDVAICSADSFFETGGNLPKRKLKQLGFYDGDAAAQEATRNRLYAESFSIERIAAAHEHCHAQFTAALQSNAQIVVVDNTNLQLKDYTTYLQEAKSHSYKSVVIELVCSNQDAAGMFHSRGKHSVPFKDLFAMMSRFEECPTAIRLQPYSPSTVPTSPPSTVPTESLSGWLTTHHCYHYSRSRPISHLQMAVGGSSARFIYVNEKRLDEFYTVFAHDTSLKYISEIATVPQFNLYVDFDYIHTQPLGDHVLAVAQLLQSACNHVLNRGPERVLLTSGGPQPDSTKTLVRTGVHLRCPNFPVTVEDALAIHAQLLTLLVNSSSPTPKTKAPKSKPTPTSPKATTTDTATTAAAASTTATTTTTTTAAASGAATTGIPTPSNGWDKALDRGVYGEANALGRALRMFGSRKVSKTGADSGPPHALLGVVVGDSWSAADKANYDAHPVALLRDCSIRFYASKSS